ncbi:hypothetical protein ON010_g16213 [Phytophthora cinnamomi]|nr:hypothetical protein ON010_g16213 [Phytophthora cinnamomi]
MPSLERLDINALPLNTPLLLMTAEGNLLKDGAMFPLVELQQIRGGGIEIRRSGAPRFLSGNSFITDKYVTDNLEPYSTPSGMVVLKSIGLDCCLGISTEGRHHCVNLLLKDLAVAALSDSSARRQLVLYLLEARNPSESVADILKLLYGAVQPLGGLITDFSIAERQEQALLKSIKLYTSMERIRAIMAVLYDTNLNLPTKDPTTTIKSEQATVDAMLAVDECSAECSEQYVEVDHASVGHAELDGIPLNTPLVMVSSTG